MMVAMVYMLLYDDGDKASLDDSSDGSTPSSRQ